MIGEERRSGGLALVGDGSEGGGGTEVGGVGVITITVILTSFGWLRDGGKGVTMFINMIIMMRGLLLGTFDP